MDEGRARHPLRLRRELHQQLHRLDATTSRRSLQIRPEIGYYRNWNNPAFDNGQKKDMFMVGVRHDLAVLETRTKLGFATIGPKVRLR